MPKLDARTKPPYRIPTMREIAELPRNGLTVASTFSGCGGSCLGYRMAGYRVAWANEFVPAAQESYRANAAQGSCLDPRDIHDVKPEEILKLLKIRKGELDLFDGSPPCQAFSTAGKGHKGWGEKKRYEGGHEQLNETLFAEWLRLLRGLMPKTFVAENVAGLVKGACKGMFLEILAEMKAAGYRVSARVLDAQWLGVPQRRRRVIFVGVREDLRDASGTPLPAAHPSPLPWNYSVRDACPWIGKAMVRDGYSGGSEATLDVAKKPAPAVTASGADVWSNSWVEPCLVHPSGRGKGREDSVDEPLATVMAGPGGVGGMRPGQTFLENAGLPPVEKECYPTAESKAGRLASGEYDTDLEGELRHIVKAESGKPSPTVRAHGNSVGGSSACGVLHPVERRKLSIAELKRICAFPDDFELVGTYAQRWERLGNSVPPAMMFWIARTIRDEILLPAAGEGPYLGDPACLVAGTRFEQAKEKKKARR